MDNIYGIIKAIIQGFVDSLKGTLAIFYLDKSIREKAEKSSPSTTEFNETRLKSRRYSQKPQAEPKILKRTFQCCCFNGGFCWLSIILIEYGILPGLRYLLTFIFGYSQTTDEDIWAWMYPFLSFTFGAFWVVPIFVLSKIVNNLWFQDIADSAYRFRQGRPKNLSKYGMFIADSLFSIIVQFLFLLQGMIINKFPLHPIGYFLFLVHMCLLYSLYAFEYRLYNMGWELHKRLYYIEANWPYFVGFGLPLALLTDLTTSYIISGCIFSILFPLFIISANEAIPVNYVKTTPCHLFSLSVAISNGIFNKIIRKSVQEDKVKR